MSQDDDAEMMDMLAERGGMPPLVLPNVIFRLGQLGHKALINLERWMDRVSSPELLLAGARTDDVHRLCLLLGCSQTIADSLFQNPELAQIALGTEWEVILSKDVVTEEGRKLMANAMSASHRFDRLRFLRQRWIVPIVLQDILGFLPQPQIWQELSDLASALIALAAEAIDPDRPIPISAIGFGKLGAGELNYSSDIDLVYLGEPTSENERFAHSLNRVLSDGMGRGRLYRVDLRLRPYGSAGPLLTTFKGYQSYYDKYAEPWEILALMRARVVLGSEELNQDFEQFRDRLCFAKSRSELFWDALLESRDRLEEIVEVGDFKRSPGGIRDIEFVTQILQMMHGQQHSELKERPTLDAIARLNRCGFLSESATHTLAAGYEFLRKLEHRCQLLDNQQTHALPIQPEERAAVAHLMKCETSASLERQLLRHMKLVERVFEQTFHRHSPVDTGEHSRLEQWLVATGDEDAYSRAVMENEGTAQRMNNLLENAPAVVKVAMRRLPLTDLIVSGEIEEATDWVSQVTPDVANLPETVDRIVGEIAAHWALVGSPPLWDSLTAFGDSLVARVAAESGFLGSVIALGSFGRRELVYGSDYDLLLLVERKEDQGLGEEAAQRMLRQFRELRAAGAMLGLDLRLRPDGGKGLLVRSFDGFRAYSDSGMDLWEQFALRSARLVTGNAAAYDLVGMIAKRPLPEGGVSELLAMKRRIEVERMRLEEQWRNVKLGHGGLSDLEWLTGLAELAHGRPLEDGSLRHRLLELRGSILQERDVESCLDALPFLLEVRARLSLLGEHEGLLPGFNDPRLEILAKAMGETTRLAFEERWNSVTLRVREIYEAAARKLAGQ